MYLPKVLVGFALCACSAGINNPGPNDAGIVIHAEAGVVDAGSKYSAQADIPNNYPEFIPDAASFCWPTVECSEVMPCPSNMFCDGVCCLNAF